MDPNPQKGERHRRREVWHRVPGVGCARDDPTGYLPCRLASRHMPLNAHLAISGQNSEMDKCGHFGPADDLLSAWSKEPSRPHRNVLL